MLAIGRFMGYYTNMRTPYTMSRIFAFLIIFSACLAHAETAQDAQSQLTGTLSAIKTSSSKQKELEEKQAALERELKSLQEETVGLARDAKQQESALSELEEKTSILEAQKKTKLTTLETRKKELSEVLAAMVKLGKLPPETIIAMPGKLNETLSAARALRVITKAVDEEANSLKAQLHELDDLAQKIDDNRAAQLRKKTELDARQKKLSLKIEERGRIHTALSGKAQEEKERMARLTEKSKNLQDLVDTLGRTERAAPEETTPPASQRQRPGFFASKPHKGRPFAQVKGRLGLPVAGKIVGLYGHSQDGAAFSKGVVIETRNGAGVAAPYDGEVVYAGVFRDYGKMVIIRHSGDYHTLLSGMESINCAPGQSLLEGEPIGSMGKGDDGGKPKLYVEMRKSGKPIDPMGWFKD